MMCRRRQLREEISFDFRLRDIVETLMQHPGYSHAGPREIIQTICDVRRDNPSLSRRHNSVLQFQDRMIDLVAADLEFVCPACGETDIFVDHAGVVDWFHPAAVVVCENCHKTQFSRPAREVREVIGIINHLMKKDDEDVRYITLEAGAYQRLGGSASRDNHQSGSAREGCACSGDCGNGASRDRGCGNEPRSILSGIAEYERSSGDEAGCVISHQSIIAGIEQVPA
ncbi:MAG: hypothetical protein WBA88_19815 [Pseudaminobacter sp.]